MGRAWSPVSEHSVPTIDVTVSKIDDRTQSRKSSRTQKPKKIVVEKQIITTRYEYSWWALCFLAFLICAILVYLLVIQITSTPGMIQPEPNQQLANRAAGESAE